MIYKGQFKDINDKLYTVKITTEKNGNLTKNITLGGSPFTTEMDSSGDIIYKPAKYQSAKCNIITPDYNFDIYAAKAQSTKIELLDDKNNIAWVGYVEPNLYNMGFVEEREEIEISAIDALSTLQYVKYESDYKKIVSFSYIINKILKQCNAYKTFYVSNNSHISSNPILNDLFISEQNFFDDKKDDETDVDVAWTCKDVLEEICQFLGLTAIADKDSVWFLDYDAIKNKKGTYYKYEIDNDTPTLVTELNEVKIDAKDYSDSGASLSLDNVYNKVKVVDDLYTYDSVIPDLYNTAKNITKSSDSTLTNSTDVNNGIFGEVVSKGKNNLIVFIDRVQNPQKNNYTSFNAVFVQYYDNPNYIFYKYDSNGNDITNSVTSLNYTDTKTMYGATIAKFCVKEMKAIFKDWDDLINFLNTHKISTSLDDWLNTNGFSNVSLQNCILMRNAWSPIHISNEQITQYPYFKTNLSDKNSLLGGENTNLIISGSYMYHYFDDDPYPIPDGQVDIDCGRYAMDETYLVAKVEWGGLYWSGDKSKGDNGWVTNDTTFQIPYMPYNASRDEKRSDATMFKDLKFVNTVTWRIGTNEEGYLITVPQNKVMAGLPTLTVYKPYDPNYHSAKSGKNKGRHYLHSCVFLKNFQFKAIVSDPTHNKLNESDTVYTNEINNEYVKELGEIKFKICTWDNKKPNYSSVVYKDSNGFQYVDKVYNDVLGNQARQEEHLINRICKQYSTESVILQLPLKNNIEIYNLYTNKTINDKLFIVDSINKDYRYNSVDVKLIEKK